MNKITVIDRVFFNTKGHSLLVEPHQILEIIKTGQFIRPLYDVRIGRYDLVSATAFIRQTISHEQQMAYKKAYLPAVNFNGEFEDGNLTNQGIVHYSDMTALDYDNIPNDEAYQYILRRLHITPCVAMTYRTPSGHGVKAIIVHDNIAPQRHGDLYEQLLKKFHVDCATLDSTCKDLRRFHYLCYDPDIWVNQSVVPYHYEPMPPQSIQTPVANLVSSTQCIEESTISDQSILNILKYRCKKYYPYYLHEGFRHEGIYWFGVRCGEAGVDYNTALDFVWNLYNSNNITYTYGGKMSNEELTQHFRRGYEHAQYNPTIRNYYKSNKN